MVDDDDDEELSAAADEIKNEILARAQEALARPLPFTPEEHEQLVRENRIAEIMARPAPSAVIHKVHTSPPVKPRPKWASRAYAEHLCDLLLKAIVDDYEPKILKLEKRLASLEAATTKTAKPEA